jgi:hypothetical protein
MQKRAGVLYACVLAAVLYFDGAFTPITAEVSAQADWDVRV